jgi:hypothetical protein
LNLRPITPEEMKQKILTFGVKKLDAPDAHLYFQAGLSARGNQRRPFSILSLILEGEL